MEEMQWLVLEGNFWDDEKLQCCFVFCFDCWVSLMWMYGGVQVEMIVSVFEEICDLFSKCIKLMVLLLKVWKGVLKVENVVDFLGLIYQVIVILEKGCFISLWKYILVDEFQDILLQWVVLLVVLCK